MSNKRIAIIGAGYLQLPIVLKASELGIETYCFAYEEGAVCRDYCTKYYPISIVKKEEILDTCNQLKIDGVLSIASDLAVATVNYIAEQLGLIGNPEESTNITTNKYSMKQVLRDNNLAIAQFEILRAKVDLDKISEFQYPVIVKPVDRSGSMGVSKISSPKQLEEAFRRAIDCSLSNEVIVEEFIVGKEISIESISQNENHEILAFTDKVTTGSPYFVELEHHQPAILDEEMKRELEEVIPKALDVLKIANGASHSEVIITEKGKIYINEIGARMGGDFIGSHLVELSTGFDYLKAVIKVSLGEKYQKEAKLNQYSGVIYRNESNALEFDKVRDQDNFIIELESSREGKSEFKKSGDRSNFLIYQNDIKFSL